MEYTIDYQYLPKGADRPEDDGAIVGIEATDKGGLVLLPAVGDLVAVSCRGGASFKGRVATRYFSYVRVGRDWMCMVNVVVAEAPDQDWGKLVKE
jgi:hypothetical protein